MYDVSNTFKNKCSASILKDTIGTVTVLAENPLNNVEIKHTDDLKQFSVEDSCYSNGTFLGTTIAKKATIEIFNNSNTYSLENKEVSIKTGFNMGNNTVEEVQFGNFIIQKPETEEASTVSTMIAYDYMIKFNKDFVDNNTYPVALGTYFSNLCIQVGLVAGNTTFPNSNFEVRGNVFQDTDCRTVLKSIAELAGGYAHIGRDNKVYILNLDNEPEYIDALSVKETSEISVSELNSTLVKYLGITKGRPTAGEIDSDTYNDFIRNSQYGPVNKVTVKMDLDVTGEETSLEDANSIAENGLTEIVISNNPLISTEADRETLIEAIWNILKGLKYIPIKSNYYGYPFLDVGDNITARDIGDTSYKSILLNHIFTYDGAFSGYIENSALTKAEVQYSNKSNIKKALKKVEFSVDKINGTITSIISEQTETSNKVSTIEQDVDGIRTDVTDIEENIEDNIPTTVQMNSAIEQKAGEITSSVSETYSTKTETNTAKAQAISSANANTDTKLQDYSTTTQMNSAITQKAGEITTEVSETLEGYSTTEDTATAKTQAINSANASTDTKLASYSTTSQMNSAINQKAGEITSSVSATYSTKTETATAKTQAINSANSSTDTKLQNYDTSTQVTSKITQKAGELTTEINKKVNDSELSTKITQNYEAVKIAWNTITQYIQFANAQLQIKDNSNKLLMALSQLGQYFYRSNGTTLIGTVGRIDNQNQIAFGINGDVSGNSMVWGIYKTINGTKTFFPVFNYGGYNVDASASEFGGLFYLEAPLMLQEQFLYLGQDNYSSYIQGLDSGERKRITLGSVDDLYITDTSNNDIFVINNEYLKFSDILEVGISYLGNYSFDFKGNAITNTSNIANSPNVKYLNGAFSGNGSLYVGERDGTGAFTLYASSSDKRLKKNIKKSKTNALDLINQISHKEFNWKSDNKHIEIGYIAQEMEELNPNFVHKAEIKNKEGATIDYEYQINLLNVLATATKAIQEQQEQIKILKEKDNQKDEIIANLIKRIEKLEAKK